MKILKLMAVLLIFAFLNTNAHAAQHCGEIKGNIVAKLLCKAKSSASESKLETGNSESSVSTETTKEKKGILSKIWKKPEWMKKKN